MLIFRSPFSGFEHKPIVLPRLKHFGKQVRLAGDDGGYREAPVDEQGETLVDIENSGIKVRPQYDRGGVELVDGSLNPNLVLPGGAGDIVWNRRSQAAGLCAMNEFLRREYNGEVVVVDGFRSVERQAAGFSKVLRRVLEGDSRPDFATLFEKGFRADSVFSSVRADRSHPFAQELIADLKRNPDVLAYVAATRKSMESVLHDVLDFCANVQYSKQHFDTTVDTPLNVDIPLVFQNNAHAGGHADDLFLFMNGQLANGQIPYDFAGIQGAMDYLEYDENFDAYNAFLNSGTPEAQYLRSHLLKLGIEGDVSWNQWVKWREAQRIIVHTAVAVGATFFSDTAKSGEAFFGAENWHFEFGAIIWRLMGQRRRVFHREPFADRYAGGNPGHALQKMGPKKAVATSGGLYAHEDLRDRGYLTYREVA